MGCLEVCCHGCLRLLGVREFGKEQVGPSHLRCANGVAAAKWRL